MALLYCKKTAKLQGATVIEAFRALLILSQNTRSHMLF